MTFTDRAVYGKSPWGNDCIAAAVLGPRGPGKRLDAEERQSVWRDLASGDAPSAYRAMGQLLGSPGQAAALLRERLRAAPVPERRLAKLIADLDANEFASREAASRELARLECAAERALRKALAGKPSLEARRRIEALLARLKSDARAPIALAALRGLAVLERLATPEGPGSIPGNR
jgi:hypothetical protein